MSLIVEYLVELATTAGPTEYLELIWDDRCKPRQRLTTDRGTEIALALPRGTVLSEGTVLYSSPERTIIVRARPEPVLAIEPRSIVEACTCAHHLGNWHRPLQVDPDGRLLAQADSPLAAWLDHHGIPYQQVLLPFQPNLRGSQHH